MQQIPSLVVGESSKASAFQFGTIKTLGRGRQHISSLDGLRGVAVLLVLLYHHGMLNSGWVGVDLFFALSGYLITAILRSSRSDVVYWKPFWIKRATRILPPFLLTLVVTSLLGVVLSSFAVSGWQFTAYLLSLGDVMAYIRRDFEPLRALWSLAVEEHFYLLWPFAVRSLSKRTLATILISLLVIEPLSRAVASLYTQDWQVVYFLTPFRLDGLCWGALLALALEQAPKEERIRSWALPTLLGGTAVWFVMRLCLGVRFTRDQPNWIYSSAFYSLLSLLSVSLVAYLLTHQRSLLSRFLTVPVLVWFGQISYGLYLYQIIVRNLLMSHIRWDERTILLLDAPLVVLLSWVSFRFFEQPLIRWGRNLARQSSVTPMGDSPSLSR